MSTTVSGPSNVWDECQCDDFQIDLLNNFDILIQSNLHTNSQVFLNTVNTSNTLKKSNDQGVYLLFLLYIFILFTDSIYHSGIPPYLHGILQSTEQQCDQLLSNLDKLLTVLDTVSKAHEQITCRF